MEDPARNALVAVYRNSDVAIEVAEEVRGLGESTVVRLDDPHDRVDSLRAEMREELEHTVFSPHAGFVFPKEPTKSLAMLVPVGAFVGALICIPLAGFAFEDSSFGIRALWAGIIGATMGATIAWIVASAMAVGGPASQSAGHVGVPVRVEGEFGPDLVEILVEHRPIRLDAVTNEGVPIGTLMTEEDLTDDGIVQRLRQQFTQNPGGSWWSTNPDVLPEIQERNSAMQQVLNEDPRPLEGGTMHDPDQTSRKDA